MKAIFRLLARGLSGTPGDELWKLAGEPAEQGSDASGSFNHPTNLGNAIPGTTSLPENPVPTWPLVGAIPAVAGHRSATAGGFADAFSLSHPFFHTLMRFLAPPQFRLLLLAASLVSLRAQAQTKWTGTISTNWSTAANWSTNAVPTASDDVLIPSGTSYSPLISDTLAVAHSVELRPTTELTLTAIGRLTVNGFTTYSPGTTYCFFNSGTVKNSGQLRLGSTSSAGGYGFINYGRLENMSGGQVTIDRTSFIGWTNYGTVVNEGKVTIGAVASVGNYGFANLTSFNNQYTGAFENKSRGELSIDRCAQRGLYNNKGTFTNEGKITIGANESVGSYGLFNQATFSNKSSGKLAIDRSSDTGVTNFDVFTNEGKITIGAVADVGTNGLVNFLTFNNKSSGQLAIDRSSIFGLFNSQGTFTNEGRITLGANEGFGSVAVSNNATFDNSGCSALLHVVADATLENYATFTNSGTIIDNSSGSSFISSNAGIVVNGNGGTFDVGSGPNQPLALVTTDPTQCTSLDGSVKLTGLKASTPYTLRYVLNAGTSTLLSPDSTSNASGELTIPGLGAGTYTLTLSGRCLPLPLTLTGTLNTPSPSVEGKPTVGGVPVCPGQAVTLTFKTTCPGGSSFQAQLSDASGSFAVPVALGEVTASGQGVVIPAGTPAGTGYRIRLVSPSGLTSEASAAFTVNPLGPVALATPTTPSRVCQGDSLSVQFSASGTCSNSPANVFTVQLSNASGSFSNPTTLGTAQPGTTSHALPKGLPVGSGYRVRIVSGGGTSSVSLPFKLEGPSFSVTPTVSGAPVCRGSQVTVSFSLPAGSCPFPQGNAFTAQLSNAFGSFTNPTDLGPVLAGQPNSLTIPASSAAGTGYRIRVVSSNPALTSANSSTFQVKGCNPRLSAEAAELVVSPNPVAGGNAFPGEIRCRVSGMDNPAFSLTTATGGSLSLTTKTEGSGEWVLTPRQRLAVGMYILIATEGNQRLTQRVVVAQ